MYSILYKFYDNETDLFNTTNIIRNFRFLKDKNKQKQVDSLQDIYPSSESEDLEETFENEEQPLDHEEFQASQEKRMDGMNSTRCKIWNGNPDEEFLNAKEPWDSNDNHQINIKKQTDISNEHRSFMDFLIDGKTPEVNNENVEIENALLFVKGIEN